MKLRRTKQFRARFSALPYEAQEQANAAYKQFAADTTHPGLVFKQVSAKGPTYAVRIGIHYRALAVKKPNCWLWYWIGPHAETTDSWRSCNS